MRIGSFDRQWSLFRYLFVVLLFSSDFLKSISLEETGEARGENHENLNLTIGTPQKQYVNNNNNNNNNDNNNNNNDDDDDDDDVCETLSSSLYKLH